MTHRFHDITRAAVQNYQDRRVLTLVLDPVRWQAQDAIVNRLRPRCSELIERIEGAITGRVSFVHRYHGLGWEHWG